MTQFGQTLKHNI